MKMETIRFVSRNDDEAYVFDVRVRAAIADDEADFFRRLTAAVCWYGRGTVVAVR